MELFDQCWLCVAAGVCRGVISFVLKQEGITCYTAAVLRKRKIDTP